MKITSKLAALLSSSIIIAGSSSMAEDIPTGSLSVGDGADAVVENTIPSVEWSITYPEDILGPKFETLTETEIKVQVLGTSIVTGGQKRFTNTEMQFSNESGWTPVFQGYDVDVDVEQVLVDKTLPKGTVIGFRTQKETSTGGVSSWRYFDQEDTDNHHVKVFRNGDALPWIDSPNSQRSIGDFFAGYLNEDETHVLIGDKQILMAVEMGTTSPGDSGYDMQDVIVLLTFTDTTQTVEVE